MTQPSPAPLPTTPTTIPTTAPAATPHPATDALAGAAHRLSDHAAEVRRLAGGLGLVAAGTGWRSTGAQACQVRLADLGQDLLGAAALLDHAAALVADHGRVAAHRAEVLRQAALEVVTGGLLGPVLS